VNRVKRYQITAGFMPLTDSAILVIAAARGFAKAEGVDLNLVRETSWANIRDRVAVGQFEAAHMLAPMPIASNLGLTPLSLKLIAPMALGLGGNTVTVSAYVWQAMRARGALGIDPARNGAALKAAIEAEAFPAPLQFAVVHPFSGHAYELRYWLSACGIDPDNDVHITVVPPSMMADALRSGRIDGFCAGEPWGSVAVNAAGGHLATVKALIWKSSPEKVLGVSAAWADSNPDQLDALLRALYHAAQWCGAPENAIDLASILSQPQWLDVDQDLIHKGLSGLLSTGDHEIDVPDFFKPSSSAANFPWQSHALWFYSQMVRWGQCLPTEENAKRAADSYRPDLFRRALKPVGAALPGASSKVEGALKLPTAAGSVQGSLVLGPDGFFDGKVFDPDLLDDYIRSQVKI
jgi:two-component system, oxyanion-binding sensor